ncbi:hypothetical protein [Methanocella conradii]|nr:hypothetical protein [Methanocella conradii]MDI6895735.1 hypothetical protein [Methanocella conradii]
MDKRYGELFVCIAFLALLLVIMPASSVAAGTGDVSRSVANNASGGYDVTIRLNDTLPIVVGIVETLPNDCTFVSTTLPADQCQVSGNKAMFVVINATEFKYTVRGASPVEVTGKWTDMLSATEGVIGKAGTTTSSGGSSGKPSSTPGFEAFLVFVSIGSLAYIARKG